MFFRLEEAHGRVGSWERLDLELWADASSFVVGAEDALGLASCWDGRGHGGEPVVELLELSRGHLILL